MCRCQASIRQLCKNYSSPTSFWACWICCRAGDGQLFDHGRGVYPYITATIIIQLLTPIIPALENLQKEGEQGRNKLNQYSWYLTVPLAALQAYGQAVIMTQMSGGTPILSQFGFRNAPLTTFAILASMTGGTLLAVWLGELISEQGIGNGTSIIILGGIVTRLPQNILNLIVGQQWLILILFVLITVLTVLASSSSRKAS